MCKNVKGLKNIAEIILSRILADFFRRIFDDEYIFGGYGEFSAPRGGSNLYTAI